MKAIIQHEGKTFSVNLNEAIDISIPMVGRSTNVNACMLHILLLNQLLMKILLLV